MERRIYLSDYTWTEDDYIPGQIKFIMSVPEKMGKASVRFYLNDGYTARKRWKKKRWIRNRNCTAR